MPLNIFTNCLFAFLLFGFSCGRLSATDYYVSPLGNDTNSGTTDFPFATISRAQCAIRTLKGKTGLPNGGVTVWLSAGYYNLSSTMVFDKRDSGTLDKPIVYAAKPGAQVYITGARTLDPSWFVAVTSTSPVWVRLDSAAKGHLYSVDLRAHGITEFGTLKNRGYGLHKTASMELFSNGQAMTLARWPNRGDSPAHLDSVLSDRQFTYFGSRPERWSNAQEIWAHGFWGNGFADYHLKVSDINPDSKTITLEAAPPKYSLRKGQPYYVYNLLEELDEPGEYYIDRNSGILYYWPNSTLSTSHLQVSSLETNLLQLTGAQHITFREIVFEASRAALLKIDSANYDRLEGCVLRNAGEYGIQINGSDSGLDQCEVVDCGEDGVILLGGNRAALVSAHNYVVNSRIHDVARISWTYHPAISLGGCGSRVTHNLIYELPHSAVIFAGNNHLIEYNEIARVCLLASDAGAIYSDRDWGYRGNIIRYNFIHHIASAQGGEHTQGVYLDDCMSSAEVFGNIFYRISGDAIACGGGRNNIITNNIIANCYIAHYCGDYARSSINNLPGSSFNLLERLAVDGIHYQQDPWASAYPALAAMPNTWAEIQKERWRNPENCVFSDNAGWDNNKWTVESDSSGTGVFSVYASISNNNPDQSALFNENVSLDRHLRPPTLIASIRDFLPIPFDSIGPISEEGISATFAPAVPTLRASARFASQVDLNWTDSGNLPNQRRTGIDLQCRHEPDGSWQVIQSFGPDVSFFGVKSLVPSTSYSFRIRAYNSIGSVFSNSLIVTTSADLIDSTSKRMESESLLKVINDGGIRG